MDVIKIEEVIVGDEIRTMPIEQLSKPVEEIPQHGMVPKMAHDVKHENLQCDQCFITFTHSKSHDRHMRKHHKALYTQQLQMRNILFSCYKCDKNFTSPEELSQHHLTHKQEEKPFSCALCDERFATLSERYQHRRRECDERRNSCKNRCTDCGTFFSSSTRLRSHRLAQHSEQLAVNGANDADQCCEFDCALQTEKDLRQHTLQCAKDPYCDGTSKGSHKRASSERQDDGDSPKKQRSAAVLQIPCSEEDCDLIFPSVAELRDHKREAHGPPPKKLHNSR